jgi:hypothetical protein
MEEDDVVDKGMLVVADGYGRIKPRYGRKIYFGRFAIGMPAQARYSRKQFKAASDAQDYAKEVACRYTEIFC